MQITTRNRWLLIAPCEDPREHHATLKLPEGQSVGLGFGVVMAKDDTASAPNERVRPDVQVGDVVYARDGAAQSVVVDGDKIWSFVNEYDVMGVIRGVTAKQLELHPSTPNQVLAPRRGVDLRQ